MILVCKNRVFQRNQVIPSLARILVRSRRMAGGTPQKLSAGARDPNTHPKLGRFYTL